MKVSYAWLNTYFKKGLFGSRLPRPARLAELLSAHAFEVEGIEKVAGDTVLDVKVLPDRAHYALSHRGIAREASVMTGIPTKPAASSHAAPDASVPAVLVRVDDSALCPRYMARRIEGVNITAAPAWLARPLERIGQQSINSVVDATNFVMYDLGQPLHAFDADKVRGQIVVRRARAGEKIVVLGGKEIELLGSDLVIADDEGAIAIAGVKGGKRAEVTEETRNIIIESANFNPT
ncbi:MAG: phenylalanine--tRNA ligase beta subunit-related protein, partial [Candidatus Paceibacterota bacterium]